MASLPPPPAYPNPAVAIMPAPPLVTTQQVQLTAGPAPPNMAAADAGAALQALCARYEIGPDHARKLRLLSDVEIVVVADDSGSMSTLVSVGADPFGPMPSRWDELKRALFQIVDIALLFDRNGIDVYFLNRCDADQYGRRIPRVLRNVTQHAAVEAAFAEPPGGFTPLAATVQRVLVDKQAVIKEKRLLILICTDGEPTTETGNPDVYGFRQVLAQRQPLDRIFVNIMACSDDRGALAYLNEMDRDVRNLDVTDDYKSERAGILARHPKCAYSLGDHIVKTLVGSLDPSIDKMDEKKGACCVLL